MSKVSEALELFRACQTDDRSIEIMIDTIPEMAELLLRCKPWIEERLNYWTNLSSTMGAADITVWENLVKNIAELSSILAEMNGEEKK